ncbi:MAG: PaaI family thioesterase [Acidimicrobiales bacterium]
MQDPGYPPSGHFLGDLGLESEVLSPGRAAVRMRVSPEVTGGDGGVRAGVLATMVDVVGGVAALRMIGSDWLATADLTLQVVRPLIGPVVEARGTVVRRGRTTLVLEAGVYDGSTGADRQPGPGAWATMTFAILPGRSPTSTVAVPDELPDRWTVSGPGFDRPIVDALSISVTDPAGGAVSMPVSEYLHNSFGAVQGGVMALLGEVAGGAALGAPGSGPGPVVKDLRLAYLALGRVGPMVSRTSVLQAPDRSSGGSAVVELLDGGAGDRLTTLVQVGAVAGA